MAGPFLHNLGELTDRGQDLSKPAIIDARDPAASHVVSHGRLDALCDSIAHTLFNALARGARVAILSANRFEYIAVYLGIMRAGMVAVPVNFRAPQALIEHVIRDSGTEFVFCDGERRSHVPSGSRVINFDSTNSDGLPAWLDEGWFQSVTPFDHEPAMFLYTSGSTGFPKGVVLSHQSHIWVTRSRIGSSDFRSHRVLVAAPLYHMNALSTSAAVLAGHGTIVMLPRFVAKDYLHAIVSYGCTWLTGVPPMMAMALQEKNTLRMIDTSRVRFIRLGSAPLSREIASAAKENFPNAAITNVYGSTEAGPVIFAPHPERRAQPLTSVGRRHPEVKIRLVDGDCLDAAEGELQVKGPGLMNGYHNQPDRTAEVMTGDGYYRSGDLMRCDKDGFYYFLGRVDDMFVSGGENIFPRQVETLLERYPGVAQACVVPVPDSIKGTKPFAFVVLRPGAAVSSDQLKQYALSHGPAYQHPRHLQFLQELPLSSTGKIDRKVLIDQATAIAQKSTLAR
jgi:acyl-CoA synthetase (AMP-forming)/AMP-acid ligase II